jgi:hypothetical protein
MAGVSLRLSDDHHAVSEVLVQLLTALDSERIRAVGITRTNKR